MVLVNTLTVEAINTALIALQRGQSIVVGGEKETTTVNNITISNSGGSSGVGLDFTPQINALDKRVGLLEKAEEVLREENERQNERLELLEGLGISDFTFDEVTRELSIELENGDTFDTTITSESFSMRVDSGELIITIGNNEQRIPLPSGVQSDWTETDSTDPSFIKNKIPIWITSGSASDNMQPVDSVTDGDMRPVTSNAVYDKHYLTSADITNQVTVDNMQSVSSNAVAISNSFTTTEQKTGGTWTDGKPIYRKVIDFGALPNAGDKTVNHNISNLNKMISIKGTSANGTQVFPIPFVNPSGIQYQIAIFTTSTQITIRTGYDRRDFTNTRIILEYTKTTD